MGASVYRRTVHCAQSGLTSIMPRRQAGETGRQISFSRPRHTHQEGAAPAARCRQFRERGAARVWAGILRDVDIHQPCSAEAVLGTKKEERPLSRRTLSKSAQVSMEPP